MTRGKVAIAAVATVTIAVLTGLTAGGARACACGAVAPPDDTDASVDGERAIVSYDGQQETITMVLDFDVDGDETGLVFPTPNPAEVSSGDPELFSEVGRQTAPRKRVKREWWSSEPGGDGAGAPDAGAPPTVLDQVQLGPLEATTLEASDASGLETWLDDNGYNISPDVLALLDTYIERGWYFVTVRITGDGELAGELDPLTFTFDTDEPVYPLALAQAATTEQKIQLNVFSDRQYEVSFPDNPADARTTWSGAVTRDELQHLGPWLTVLEMRYSTPAAEIEGDLFLTPAPENEEIYDSYVETDYVQIAGIPAGRFLVGAGVLIAALLIFVMVRRQRGRAPFADAGV